MAILLLATALRLVALPELPGGLNFDEAGNGVAALDVLAGEPRLWWRIGGGKEPLWPYLVAASTWVLGNEPLALRLPAAMAGVLTVAAVYPLARGVFRREYGPSLAVLAMLGVAVSGWHLHFSRLGFRAILLPLLASGAVYWYWQAVRRGRDWAGLVCAGAMALGVYAYLAGRLLPGVVVVYAAGGWLLALGSRENSGTRIDTDLHRFLRVMGWLAVFLLPLGFYFALYPGDLVARAGAVSIFNPVWHQGDLGGTFARTLALTLGTFAGVTGDANPLVNLPGEPALAGPLNVFFGLGIVVAGWRAWRLEAGYWLVLVWWGVMLLPAVLAPEGAPHHLRLMGALVPTYILVALGLVTAGEFVARWWSAGRWVLYGLVFAVVGWQTTVSYFVRWPESVDFTLPLDLYAVELAEEITAAPAGTGYVLPMDIRAGAEARHYTLDYLLAGEGGYLYLPVDERNAERILSEAAQRWEAVRVVRWTADKHLAADEKGIVSFLLATHGELQEATRHPVYTVETYRLEAEAVRLPPITAAVGATFAEKLRLDSAYLPERVAAGAVVPVAVTLAPVGPMAVDYKASVRLVDAAGTRVAQVDRVLRHNFHQGTSLWPAETVNEYYLLPAPGEAGVYSVRVVVYHPETLAALGEVEVGTVLLRKS